ncbi:MAG: hypothetical protein ChlgKO_10320 [Chlamydiales bacterium]
MNCLQREILTSWLAKHTREEIEVASLNITISELALLHTVNGYAPYNMPLINERQFTTFMDHLTGVKKITIFEKIERVKRKLDLSKVMQFDPEEEFDKIAARHNHNNNSLEANSPNISAYETLLPDFPHWNHRVETEAPSAQLINDLSSELVRISTVFYQFLVPKMQSMVRRHSENPEQISFDYSKIYDFSMRVVPVAFEGIGELIDRVHAEYAERFPDVLVGLPVDFEIEGDMPVGILLNDESE